MRSIVEGHAKDPSGVEVGRRPILIVDLALQVLEHIEPKAGVRAGAGNRPSAADMASTAARGRWRGPGSEREVEATSGVDVSVDISVRIAAATQGSDIE